MKLSPIRQTLCLLLVVVLSCGSFQPSDGFLLPTSTTFTSSGTPVKNNKKASYRLTKLLLSSTANADNNEELNPIPRRSTTSNRRKQHKDVVIIGGGLAGLSVALYLNQIDPSRQITILDKEMAASNQESKKKTTIASFAAAGMLAPQSERLPKGHLLNLCLESRRMYPEFCDLVESMARESGEEGKSYLLQTNTKEEDVGSSKSQQQPLEPWSVGYIASGGFLAPAFAGDTVATWAPPEEGGGAMWMDETQVRELEPNLHPDVVGGWWFPEDASVDARRLTCSLYAACAGAGIQFMCGKNYEVSSLDLSDGQCHGMWLKNGYYLKTNSVLVANGAWMRNLLPVPITPHKGQSLALKMPSDRPPILRRVLFAQDCYIVPKADGNIVIGATVEAGSFDGNVTPAGLLQILTHALQLVPGLQDLPVVETWAGLRPTTPDKGPILGRSPWKNLFLAGGYWRNGVLLAPKTAQLLASLMSGIELSPKDEELLQAFSWDRFTVQGGGAALAASARYAASMHPIQSRKSGIGVAAAVGTELGAYSTAKVAKDERARDRNALWDESGDDDSFEQAAMLGRQDAQTFSFGDESDSKTPNKSEAPPPPTAQAAATTENEPQPAPVATDATASSADNDMSSIYEKIKANKAKQDMKLPDQVEVDDRPDPGFRIYHVDSETGEEREVPPYTSPGEFLSNIAQQKEAVSSSSSQASSTISKDDDEESSEYNEKTYDGYQDIQDANASQNRDEELEAMRKARMSNRMGQEAIDESLIGAKKYAEAEESKNNIDVENKKNSTTNTNDISSMYETIKANKAKQKMTLPDASESSEDRPDPGFRIYHIDSETGESREVPPYTSPGEFLSKIAEEKKKEQPNSLPTDISTEADEQLKSGGINGADDPDYNEKTYVMVAN